MDCRLLASESKCRESFPGSNSIPEVYLSYRMTGRRRLFTEVSPLKANHIYVSKNPENPVV